MSYTQDDLILARRHVAEGEARIDRQMTLIDGLVRGGHPTELAEALLANLQDVTRHMRDHLQAIETEVGQRRAR